MGILYILTGRGEKIKTSIDPDTRPSSEVSILLDFNAHKSIDNSVPQLVYPDNIIYQYTMVYLGRSAGAYAGPRVPAEWL